MVIMIEVDGRSNIYRKVSKALYGDYMRGFYLMSTYSKHGAMYILKGKEKKLVKEF